MTEPIIDYLRRRLKEAPGRWPAIAAEVSKSLPARFDGGDAVTTHSLRKIAYGDRVNPGLVYVQALLDYLRADESRPEEAKTEV